MFLPHKCNINTFTKKKVSGSLKSTSVSLYSQIKCIFWATGNGKNSATNIGRNTQDVGYNVIIEGDKSGVIKGMNIELFNGQTSIGLYTIKQVDYNYTINGLLDNIYLVCTTNGG